MHAWRGGQSHLGSNARFEVCGHELARRCRRGVTGRQCLQASYILISKYSLDASQLAVRPLQLDMVAVDHYPVDL